VTRRLCSPSVSDAAGCRRAGGQPVSPMCMRLAELISNANDGRWTGWPDCQRLEEAMQLACLVEITPYRKPRGPHYRQQGLPEHRL
jgi:hypothetical protein